MFKGNYRSSVKIYYNKSIIAFHSNSPFKKISYCSFFSIGLGEDKSIDNFTFTPFYVNVFCFYVYNNPFKTKKKSSKKLRFCP